MQRAGGDHALICTVGHSNRSLAALAALLQAAEVRQLADIRSVARSRHNPQFDADVIAEGLRPYGIGYVRIEELGGLRGRSKTVPPEVNAYWSHPSFHNYADYALTAPFRAGLQRLLALADAQRTAIMCAEALWWRCHRRIVADYLLHAGREVRHLMADGRSEPARMNDAAVPTADGLRYPAPQPPQPSQQLQPGPGGAQSS